MRKYDTAQKAGKAHVNDTSNNMEEALVSVIVAVYNVKDYLVHCLESIVRQTYRNLEIIIIDDGSKDGSEIICDTYAQKDKRATAIHQQNQGLWAARNRGQRAAKGEYILFVDGDDYMHLDAIKTLLHAINHSKKYDIAIIDYKETDKLDEDITCPLEKSFEELQQSCLVPHLISSRINSQVWNKLYRSTLIENIYANDYSRSQDFDFNIRVFLNTKSAIFIHSKMYFWVQRPTSVMHRTDFWDIAYECHVRMFYENYTNLTDCQKHQYGYCFLSFLYKRMVFYKNKNYKTDKEPQVFKQCKEYELKTRKDYLLNWRINPFEKIGVTILLHNPRLTRWLMRVTNN